MVGPVVDLAFSHATDEVVLGAVDSYGNLFVYKVEEQGSGTVTERMVEIMRNATGQDKLTHRLVWCPYVPDPESDASDNVNGQRMLVLTWQVEQVQLLVVILLLDLGSACVRMPWVDHE